MKRRQFVVSGSALALASALPFFSSQGFAQSVSAIDAVNEIKKLRISTGTFTGAYLVAPAGRINWYFTNLGILPMIQYLNAAELDWYIRTYLDLYLRRLEANSSIQDINFVGGPDGAFQTVLSDSDDSYAATTLAVIVRYLHASQNWTWWEENKVKIKSMAYSNLAVSVKANGLTSLFQSPRNQTNSIGYLMDNCEVYSGLRGYAALLRERGESADASYYDSFATNIAAGINNNLFDSTRNGFIPNDVDAAANSQFYAGTTCQVFPQAFGVNELAPFFDLGWAYLNQVTPSWQDGRYDVYPWAILGFVAAKRGAISQAQEQLQMINNKFLTNRAVVTINELGFYQRTASLLAGKADI